MNKLVLALALLSANFIWAYFSATTNYSEAISRTWFMSIAMLFIIWYPLMPWMKKYTDEDKVRRVLNCIDCWKTGAEVYKETGLYPGTVYPLLGKLVDKGYTTLKTRDTTSGEGYNRLPLTYFQITQKGKIALTFLNDESLNLAR